MDSHGLNEHCAEFGTGALDALSASEQEAWLREVQLGIDDVDAGRVLSDQQFREQTKQLLDKLRHEHGQSSTRIA